MKYKNILFDLDNTLWDFNLAEKLALSEFFISKGLNSEKIDEYIQQYKKINKKLWERFENSEITRETLLNTRFYEFFKSIGILIDGKKFSDEYEKIIGLHGESIEGAYEFLELLKSKGFRMFAITNGIYNIQINRLKNSKISKFFDKVFISEEVGFVKPDVKYFEFVEKSVNGFNKKETILIGDSISADIKGANNFGIDSIWYNPGHLELKDGIIPDFIVSTYSEIIKILE